MHKPSLVDIDDTFEEYSVDISDTFEEYSDVLWLSPLFVRVAALGGRESSGGDGGFGPVAGCRCSSPLVMHWFKVYVLVFWKMFFCGSSNCRWSSPTFRTLLIFRLKFMGWCWEIK